MEISHAKRLLVLSFSSPHNKYSLKIFPDLQDLLIHWSPTSRVSPIFGLTDYRDHEFVIESDLGTHYVIFVGPLMPIRAAEFCDDSCGVWLTCGLYNIIVQTPSKTSKDRIIRWLKKNNVRYELWRLRNELIDATYLSPPSEDNGEWRSILSELSGKKLPLKLDATRDEYCPLMATSISRASIPLPEIVEDLDKVNHCILDVLEDDCSEDLTRQHEINGLLAKTNAGLSRFSSQTFSGTSPITGTECHYWTHSLLGTGIANFALYKLVSYVRDKLGVYNIPARLENLAFTPIKPLNKIKTDDEFWYQDYLKESKIPDDQLSETPTPLITYFSGRDGFKSSETTLSAPLAAISGCNSRYWDLMTITHELSHLFVRGCLGLICPDRTSEESVQNAVALLTKRKQPQNWVDELTRYLCASFIDIHQTENDIKVKLVNEEILKEIIDKWYHKVEEILAHVFDFMYFYKRDVEKYISSIWLSWSVIPNISHRIDEYVLRTLCAVLSCHLRRSATAENETYGQVHDGLLALSEKESTVPYLKDALINLEKKWDVNLRKRLLSRKSLVLIVRTFLYSDSVAARLFQEKQLSGQHSEKNGYDKQTGIFDDRGIDNPLRFMSSYATDSDPRFSRALWMLSNVSFNSKWK